MRVNYYPPQPPRKKEINKKIGWRGKMADHCLDKAFDLLTACSNQALHDECQYFGNMLAAKLRNYKDTFVSKSFTHFWNDGADCLDGNFEQFDSGIQRFMSMRATEYDHFKPTPKTSLYGLCFIVIPMAAFAYLVKSSRDAQEHKYRTGQVAYKDRRFKFI